MTLSFPSTPRGWQIILADPPWRFQTRSKKGRGRCPDAEAEEGAAQAAGRARIHLLLLRRRPPRRRRTRPSAATFRRVFCGGVLAKGEEVLK